MKNVVIVGAKRTAIGAYLGQFAQVSAVELGATAVRAVIDESGLSPEQVDNIVMGNVLSAGLGQNPARQVARAAGIPDEKTANVVSMVCGSGLKAVMDGVNQIRTGEADIVVAGGMESMSNAGHVLNSHRTGSKMGHAQLTDTMLHDGLTDAFGDFHMGITAENLAKKYHISREEQDAYAVRSQNRARKAIEAGRFDSEIVPYTIQGKKGTVTVCRDEFPKFDSTVESVSKLKPAFVRDGSGTVTAANASGINDGAAALLLMSEDRARELGLKPMATVLSQGAAGVAPEVMGFAPVPASLKALKAAGLTVSDMNLVEANEAFASQALSVCKGLDLKPDITNVNGGAIALGHPIGASGARILVTLVHELTKRKQRYGLATLCIGGGQGVAVVIEGH